MRGGARAAVDCDEPPPRFPQSWNRYAYVGGTPLEAVDPLGLCPSNPQGCAVSLGGPACFLFQGCGSAPMPSAGLSTEMLSFIMGGLNEVISKAEAGFCVVDDQEGDSNAHLADAIYHPNEQPRVEKVFWPHCTSAISNTGGRSRIAPVVPTAPAGPVKAGPCPHGFGFGGQVGASGEGGFLAPLGAGAQSSAGLGAFFSRSGASIGAFAEGGAAALAGSHMAEAPAGFAPPEFAGAFVGAGAAVFVTNAGSASQLAGPFLTLSANFGLFFKLSAQLSIGPGGTYVLSVGAGPGVGASASGIATQTLAANLFGGGC